MSKQPDFVKSHTVETLIQFAERFPRDPYLILRGTHYVPLFYGPSETLAYRVSESLADKGTIVAADADGQPFSSRLARDLHAVTTARKSAPTDPTWPDRTRTLPQPLCGHRATAG